MKTRINSIEPLPSPEQLRRSLPISPRQHAFVEQSRATIRAILHHQSPKKLLIVGPCSVHSIIEAREYASRLRELSDRLQAHFFIVMRTYFEKPRTAIGWKGILYDPHLDGSHQVRQGLELARQLLLELADMQVPAGTEFLDPITPHYLGDLISWSCVGARTAASQIHRQMASHLNLPVGFKNSVEGHYEVAINGVLSGSTPHTFLGISPEGCIAQLSSPGNPDCHVILRGGDERPNFDPETVHRVSSRLQALRLPQRLLIDCSHDNSRRDHRRQPAVFQAVFDQIVAHPQIAGLLLESYLCAGNQEMPQQPSPLRYGISLTDPCLDWESTENLLLWAHQLLAETSYVHQTL